MARSLFLMLLFAPACADGSGSKDDGDGIDSNGDGTTETGDSGGPFSEHAVTVAFTTEYHGDALVFAAPGQSGVTFGSFLVTDVDGAGLALRAFVPTVYVADDADASSGWHASHQGNVWAKDHLASCVFQGWPNADATLGEKSPDDEGLLSYDGEYQFAAAADTGADTGDTAADTGTDPSLAQAFDLVCDFTRAAPQDGLAVFAVDLRDGASVDARDQDGMRAPVTVTASNGDPPMLYVTLSG